MNFDPATLYVVWCWSIFFGGIGILWSVLAVLFKWNDPFIGGYSDPTLSERICWPAIIVLIIIPSFLWGYHKLFDETITAYTDHIALEQHNKERDRLTDVKKKCAAKYNGVVASETVAASKYNRITEEFCYAPGIKIPTSSL